MTAIMEPPAKAPPAAATEFRAIPPEQLHESPKNPRTHYDPVALQQLAENMKAVGQITAAVVRPRPKGKGGYELAAGHRRLRAAKLAGLPTLKAEIRDLDEAQFVEILNIENLQRDDLNALEEAQGFVSLVKDAGYDIPKIAARVGRSVKYVYDRVKLLQLIPEAKKLLADGTITAGHGILLARLSKDDQKRALEADDGSYRSGGLLEREQIDGSYFPDEPRLELDDSEPKKARSVRELAQWIDRNVRFVPEKVDQGDLAFDLPKTAELLAATASNKLKVVKITREYRVPDEARDQKERTYGVNGWKRADGEPEDADRWHPAKKPKASKTCEYSRPGLVVAGPGRGEAFMVCVNKEKCAVHWAEEMKEREKRAKAREREVGKNGGRESTPQRDGWEVQEERRKRAAELQPARTALVQAVLAKVEAPLPVSVLRFVAFTLLQHSNVAAELAGVGGTGKLQGRLSGLAPTQLARAIVAGLIGSEAIVQQWQPDAKPLDLLDLCHVYGIKPDQVAAQVKAAEAAKAKAAPAQTSAKAKKRAGDVARAKRAKRAKAAKGKK